MVKMKKGLFWEPHQGNAKPVASKDTQLGSGAKPKWNYLEFASSLDSQPPAMDVKRTASAYSDESGMLITIAYGLKLQVFFTRKYFILTKLDMFGFKFHGKREDRTCTE